MKCNICQNDVVQLCIDTSICSSIMCYECLRKFESNKNEKTIKKILRDFAIQWGQACKYKRYEEYTFAELDDWIDEYIKNRLVEKP